MANLDTQLGLLLCTYIYAISRILDTYSKIYESKFVKMTYNLERSEDISRGPHAGVYHYAYNTVWISIPLLKVIVKNLTGPS